MEKKTNRKYNSEFRKKLVTKLDYFKDKDDLIEIYNIITSNNFTNYSSNVNGYFFNLNCLDDICIDKLVNKINKN